MIPLLLCIACLAFLTAHLLIAINKMNRRTCAYIRFAFVAMTIGSFSWMCDFIEGHQPTVSEMLFIGSLTVFFHSTRRKDECLKIKEV